MVSAVLTGCYFLTMQVIGYYLFVSGWYNDMEICR
jgi:hypothetical protein